MELAYWQRSFMGRSGRRPIDAGELTTRWGDIFRTFGGTYDALVTGDTSTLNAVFRTAIGRIRCQDSIGQATDRRVDPRLVTAADAKECPFPLPALHERNRDGRRVEGFEARKV